MSTVLQESQKVSVVISSTHPVVLVQLEYQIDYNEAAKTVVSTGLGLVPFVGFALSALVTIFWPASKEDVWAEIEARMEALVKRKIADRVWQETRDALAGLRNVVDDYVYVVREHPDDKEVISQKWNIANGHFLHDLPRFQSEGYELLLLPLFAQFANLHLTLLRDGAQHGADWGWSQALVESVRRKLAATIAAYLEWAGKTYEAGLAEVDRTPGNSRHTEPFNTINRFRREMTLTVLDFSLMWPYFDVIRYPDPVQVPVIREIYSDLCGTADDSGVSLPARPPTQPIRRVVVWGWDRVDAAQVDYPDGGGPDGRTSTGRMGNRSGGNDGDPWGGTYETAQTGPVVRVDARTGDILNAMWLTFENGARSRQLGGRYPGGSDSAWQYPGEILSSIRIMGVSRHYGSANAAVYGFKYKDERFPRPTAEVLRALYMSDPASPTPRQFVEKLGLAPEEREQVVGWAGSNHWDMLREVAVSAQAARLAARAAE